MQAMMILNGCGYLDGSEIHEVVLTTLALENQGFSVQMFALDEEQTSVCHHLTQEEVRETRHQLTESARLARGCVQPLGEARVQDFDVVVIPGGFGSAKNLCDFSTKGVDMTVHPDIVILLKEAYLQSKPLGGLCIAPVLFAKVLGDKGVKVTLGGDGELRDVIEEWGGRYEPCQQDSCVRDFDHKVVSTPAYMIEGAQMKEIWLGIQELAQTLKDWTVS